MHLPRFTAAFTLIELLITISIIAILTATAVVFYTKSQEGARFSRVLEDMRAIANAAEIANDANNRYADDALRDVLPSDFTPYMKNWPKPPCAGWAYDWEYWSSNGETIRITLRNTLQTGGAVYYYCVYTTGTCNEGDGTDVKLVTDKRLVCT